MTVQNKWLIALLFLWGITAQAEQLHSLADIEQTAYIYALNDAQVSYSNPQILVNSLDNRLRLQVCNMPLQAFANTSQNTIGSRTIGVRCPAAASWTIYVPVKVKVMKEVVVAARSISAHSTLSEQDVKVQMMDLGELRQGFVTQPELVIGQQLKYPVLMGMVIPSRSLKQVQLVRKGEQIMLVASAGGMQVRMAGIAMDNASLGEKIRVKNSSSERVVEGVVDAPGVVRVTM